MSYNVEAKEVSNFKSVYTTVLMDTLYVLESQLRDTLRIIAVQKTRIECALGLREGSLGSAGGDNEHETHGSVEDLARNAILIRERLSHTREELNRRLEVLSKSLKEQEDWEDEEAQANADLVPGADKTVVNVHRYDPRSAGGGGCGAGGGGFITR